MSTDKPPFYVPPLALWNRKLGYYSLFDRYHRIPLLPIPCRTLEAVARVAAQMLERYIRNPIVDSQGNWITCCADDADIHPDSCVHGRVRL